MNWYWVMSDVKNTQKLDIKINIKRKAVFLFHITLYFWAPILFVTSMCVAPFPCCSTDRKNGIEFMG